MHRNLSATQARRAPAAFALLAAVLVPAGLKAQSASASTTDETFVFTADTHVSYNGVNDAEGIGWDGANPILSINETSANAFGTQSHNGCIMPSLGFWGTKDLCNQVLQIRKINAIPSTSWKRAHFKQGTHVRTLASSGPVAAPSAVLLGGDMTDCGGGVDDSNCDNGGYGVPSNGAQMNAFEALYDSSANASLVLNGASFLPGLSDPDGSFPMRFPLFPGFGNHDLQFSGSYTRDYLTNFILFHMSSLTNFDLASLCYSFNLGNVHVVNVNVYPGSGTDTDLTFSSEAMTWFKNDLAKFASDGRPVVIYAHFGFDVISLSNSWWMSTSPDRVDGYNQLWPAIQNYNVIGYFQGHNHGQAAWSTYAGPGALPYDVFRPGAGYYQDFDVVHVTDSHMDVMTTADNVDYNSTGTPVAFNPTFTKQLVAPPTRVTTPMPAPQGIALNASSEGNGATYLLNALPGGVYVLDMINTATGALTFTDSGIFPGGDFPSAIASYTLLGQPHFVILDHATLYDCIVGANNRLSVSQQLSGVYGQAAIVYHSPLTGSVPYLVVDNSIQSSQIDVYRLGSGSPVLSATFPATLISGVSLMRYNFSAKQLGLIRADISTGLVEYDALTLEPSQFSYRQVGTEFWPKDFRALSVPMPNGSTQILVSSPSCTAYDSAGNCVTPSTDSPYYIRTMLADDRGTDISWRGFPVQLMLPYPSAIVPLGTLNGAPLLGLYFNSGFFEEVTLAQGAPRS